MFDNSYGYILMALVATLMTWGVTALGSATVFLFRRLNEKVTSIMFGFGAGVMLAASFFSLILPAMDMSIELNQNMWLIIGLGFLSGALFILVFDYLLPHVHINKKEPEGINSNFSRKILLIFAITLHNIPEGLAVGVAFGAAAAGVPGATYASAWILAIAIALQNFPEGMAVSLPLRQDGMSRKNAFLSGQMSGLVEPIAAVIGTILVMSIRTILPFILCFAAGAMVYVVAEELIPSGKEDRSSKFGTIGVIIGFTLMMILDIALG